MPLGDEAPINIDSSIVSNDKLNCTSNCDLKFKYNSSSCVITKQDRYYEIKYDRTNQFPVSFNNNEYKPDYIRIYQESLHTYEGNKAAAEMLIYHTNNSGETLIICIPIEVGSSGKQSSDITNQILQNLPKSETESTRPSEITNFNLGDLIPKSGFYTYVASDLFSKKGVVTYVVYHKKDAITVSRDSITSVNDTKRPSAIKRISVKMATTDTVYLYNKNGANNSGTDEYYLQCDNTGQDGTILYKGTTPSKDGSVDKKSSGSKSIDWKSITNDPSFKKLIVAISAIVFTLLLSGIGYVILKLLEKIKKQTDNSGGAGAADSGATAAV
jgi:hypothetical protein